MNKFFKKCFENYFILIILTLLIENVCTKPQINISQSDDIQILSANGMIVCDAMQCPIGSHKCIVKKYTTDDLNWIIRKKICLHLNGNVLLQDETKEENLDYPKIQISIYAESLSNGNNIVQCRNCNDLSKLKLMEINREQQEQFAKSWKMYQTKLNETINDYKKNLQNSILSHFKNSFS